MAVRSRPYSWHARYHYGMRNGWAHTTAQGPAPPDERQVSPDQRTRPYIEGLGGLTVAWETLESRIGTHSVRILTFKRKSARSMAALASSSRLLKRDDVSTFNSLCLL